MVRYASELIFQQANSNVNKQVFGTILTNVKAYGAKGDGVTDDTAAIQAALNAGNHVYFPEGTYIVSATLTGKPNQIIEGASPQLCQLYRTTAYGHTLVLGADVLADNTDHAGAVRVKGLWFHHVYQFNNGSTYVAGTSTSITNKDPSSSHIKITQGQGVEVEDCWFYGLGYHIEFIDTTIMWVKKCIFVGMWDTNVSGLQDSTASIYVHASTSTSRCGIMNVTGCHIGGYAAGAPVDVTTGAVTVSKALNAGTRYGILIESCEQFSISDNYIGGQSVHCIYLSARAVISHGTIRGNMIDSAGEYSIQMDSYDATYYSNFIVIANNTGVGYGLDQGFLFMFGNSTNTSGIRVNVSDNVIQQYYRCPIRIQNAKDVHITNNIVAAYNSDGDTDLNPRTSAGLYTESSSDLVNTMGNSWGGGVNDPSAANNCRWGPYIESTNSTSGLERNSGLGATGGSLMGGINQTYPT